MSPPEADRLPPLAPASWSEHQRAEAEAVMSGPRGGLLAPFVPLLRSPELMGHVQRLGAYVRYRNALGTRLTELAILVTARHWSQQVEWAFHAPIAAQAGIGAGVIDAIAHGRPPEGLAGDEQIVLDLCTELHRTQRISDATWQAAIARFGEAAVVDLLGVCGYYTLLSMVMNAAQTPAPPSEAAPLPPLSP